MGTTDQPIAGEVKLLLPGGNNDESFLKNAVFFSAGIVRGHIYGGPFMLAQQGLRRLILVKMAEEITQPCDIDVPTEDYKTPPKDVMLNGLIKAVAAIKLGNDIYVGCMGGKGRTGTFMATLLKSAMIYNGTPKAQAGQLAIKVVRQNYDPHACETAEQERYVRDFDVSRVVADLKVYNGFVKQVPLEKEKPAAPKPGYVDAILAFAKALVVFLPALILFLAFFKGKQK